MIFFKQLSGNLIIEALGWTLFQFIWQGLLLAMLAAVLLFFLRAATANVRYVVACGLLATMAVLPCFNFCQIIQPAARESQFSKVLHHDMGLAEFATEKLPVALDFPTANTGGVAASTDTEGFRRTATQASSSFETASFRRTLQPALPWLVAIWIVGVCLLSCRLLVSWYSVHRLKCSGWIEVSAAQNQLISELSMRLGVRHCVKMTQSALVEVPTLIGWVKPIILMPATALTGLDDTQLSALLAHELAHVRRADYAVNLVQMVVETLLFYHPAVWWLSARIRQERENCCDDLAANECAGARLYAAALLQMEELRSVAAPLALSARGGSLKQRISRLLVPMVTTSQRSDSLVAALPLAIVTLVLISLLFSLPNAALNEAAAETNVDSSPVKTGENKKALNNEQSPHETVINAVPADILTKTVTISGQAFDTAGQPVAGATIYIASHAAFHKLLKTTVTNKEGEYTFRDLELPINRGEELGLLGAGHFEIYGTAAGYAFSWRGSKWYSPGAKPLSPGTTVHTADLPDAFRGNEPIVVDLTFHLPARLSGTIVAENGKPIPNTKVHLFNCWRAPIEGFSDSDMFQVDMSSLYSTNYCPREISTTWTNAQGEFRFPNAPPECRYRISLKPPNFASRMMYATTEKYPPSKRNGKKLERDGMQLVFDTTREVKIQLVGLAKPEHGKGAAVNPISKLANGAGYSNEQGLAAMKIPPGDYKVSILPPTGTPYLATEEKITVTSNSKQTFELAMRPAAVVIVQVLDVETGTDVGLSGFDLWREMYHLSSGKVRIQRDLHMFRSYEQATRICHVHHEKTDETGRLQANFEPGAYRIGIGLESRPEGWEILDKDGKEIDIQPGEPTLVKIRVRRKLGGDKP